MKDELFTEEVYHVDTSHLASVVQMALELPAGPHLTKARELCDYGRRLAPAFRPGGDCPFERDYDDYGTLLAIMDNVCVGEGLRTFEAKISPELAEGNTFPAEVYINLLLKLNRKTEALQAAKRYLSDVPTDTPLSCPTLLDLARQSGEFRTFAEAAKAQGDAVQYLAGLIAARSSG